MSQAYPDELTCHSTYIISCLRTVKAKFISMYYNVINLRGNVINAYTTLATVLQLA